MEPDGSDEGFEMIVKVLWVNAKIPVEEEEKLFLHKIDFGEREAEAFVAFDGSIAGPVLILW